MERSIIFNTEGVKAILDGRKTMTRRVIKPQPKLTIADGFYKANIQKLIEGGDRVCPHGQIGDRLWVKETWAPVWGEKAIYRADGEAISKDTGKSVMIWHPSIFMFRKDSRLLLEITGLRAERLQEITEEDALAEGCLPKVCEEENMTEPATIEFEELWDFLNAKRGYGWDKNPWVWVIRFDNIGVRVK